MLYACDSCHCELPGDDAGDTVLCPKCGGLLQARAASASDSSENLSELETATFTAPDQVGGYIQRYRLVRSLGRGGFGEVYLARDEDLSRDVAIKIPRADRFTSDDSIGTFLAEARTAAQLKHPCIATIYDVGPAPDVGCFIAMEYIAGTSLASLLVQGPLPPVAAARLLAQLATAAHYAHLHGVVHRDIKPANVIIDRQQQPHILDFGLGLSGANGRQSPNTVAGTPRYMPPEQSLPGCVAVDGRADIWSIGVILYQALTGRYPFGGTQDQAMEAARLYDPRPPRQIDDTIPIELERITLRCLCKLPRDRYATAKDLADDLNAWLAAHTVQTESQGSIRTLPQPAAARKHWLRWRFAGAALLLAAVWFPLVDWSPLLKLTPGGGAAATSPETASPLIPNVEPVYAVNTWNELLERDPLELAFPRTEPFAVLSRNAEQKSLFINCVVPTSVATGTSTRPDFQLSVGIAKTQSQGSTGIVFGLRPTDPAFPDGELTCQAVYADLANADGVYVSRARMHLTPLAHGKFYVSSIQTFRSKRVAGLPRREVTLRLSVQRRMVTEIRWDGESLEELLQEYESPESNVDLKLSAAGRFGLFNSWGGAAFLHHQFMPLE